MIHLGVTYTIGFSLQCYRMKVAGQQNCLTRIFEWFLQGNNTTLFLRMSIFVNFSFSLIPIISLAYYTVPLEDEPLLSNLRIEHPQTLLVLIRQNYVFLAGVFVCGLIVTLEISYCLKTNWSTFRVCSFLNIVLLEKLILELIIELPLEYSLNATNTIILSTFINK